MSVLQGPRVCFYVYGQDAEMLWGGGAFAVGPEPLQSGPGPNGLIRALEFSLKCYKQD